MLAGYVEGRDMISEIVSILPQADGRAYVRERHTDQYGIAHEVEYLAAAGTDYHAVMLARAQQIANELRQRELEYWLSEVREGHPIPVDGTRYVTREEAFAYCFKTLAFDPNPQESYRAAWMISYFTDDELIAFGFTPAQVVQIRENGAKLDQARELLGSVGAING